MKGRCSVPNPSSPEERDERGGKDGAGIFGGNRGPVKYKVVVNGVEHQCILEGSDQVDPDFVPRPSDDDHDDRDPRCFWSDNRPDRSVLQ